MPQKSGFMSYKVLSSLLALCLYAAQVPHSSYLSLTHCLKTTYYVKFIIQTRLKIELEIFDCHLQTE